MAKHKAALSITHAASLVEQLCGFCLVLAYAYAFCISNAKIKAAVSITHAASFVEQLGGFCLVFAYAYACAI